MRKAIVIFAILFSVVSGQALASSVSVSGTLDIRPDGQIQYTLKKGSRLLPVPFSYFIHNRTPMVLYIRDVNFTNDTLPLPNLHFSVASSTCPRDDTLLFVLQPDQTCAIRLFATLPTVPGDYTVNHVMVTDGLGFTTTATQEFGIRLTE